MLLLRPKSPDETKFYEFDWAEKRLDVGEVITSYGWEVAQGTVEVAADPPPSEPETGVLRVYLTGGTLGETCIVTSWVETNLNPRRDYSAKLKIRQI